MKMINLNINLNINRIINSARQRINYIIQQQAFDITMRIFSLCFGFSAYRMLRKESNKSAVAIVSVSTQSKKKKKKKYHYSETSVWCAKTMIIVFFYFYGFFCIKCVNETTF